MGRSFRTAASIVVMALLALAGCTSTPSTPRATLTPGATVTPRATATPGATLTPRATLTPFATVTPGPSAPVPPPSGHPDHVVVVIFENKAETEVMGAAPTFDALAARGARYPDSFAITHPSEPNYLALFSGGTHGVTNDACPLDFGTQPNVAAQLYDAGLSFTGFAEGLPSPGYTGCRHGRYARKHAPWLNFGNVPTSATQPFTAFPGDFAALPALSFVIPDLCSDMHDCPVATGDAWLREHVTPYADWAMTHHGLLVVTFDEDDTSAGNRITTFIVGEGVAAGTYRTRIDHYTVLRTIESCFDLPPIGLAAEREPLPQVCR